MKINSHSFLKVVSLILFTYSLIITILFVADANDFENISGNIEKNNFQTIENSKVIDNKIKEIEKIEEEKKVFINKNYFIDNLELKDYSGTKFKITKEGKKLVNNIRNIHKSASLIGKENADRAVCAGYIWTLSEKLWGKGVPYHIGMINADSGYPAKAWELPSYYSGLGGYVLIDLSEKFSVEKNDYWEKLKISNLKEFYKTAFLEEAIFGDIGFLYSDTKYSNFLKGWSSNSHISKNLGASEFEFIVGQDYENLSNIEILSKILKCDENINRELFSLFENYKLYLNGKRVVLKDKDIFVLDEDNYLGEKIKLKYLDKITYKDITLSHYFDGRSNVNGLFDMVCTGKFFPINIISINSRLIEKM